MPLQRAASSEHVGRENMPRASLRSVTASPGRSQKESLSPRRKDAKTKISFSLLGVFASWREPSSFWLVQRICGPAPGPISKKTRPPPHFLPSPIRLTMEAESPFQGRTVRHRWRLENRWHEYRASVILMTWRRLLCGLSWTVLIGVDASLLYCQLHSTLWWCNMRASHYSRGWPFPYGGAGEGLYPLRLCLDLVASFVVLASTFVVTSSWARHGCQFHLGTLFLIQTAVAIVCILQLVVPGLLWPSWEPWYIRSALMVGGCCTVLCVIGFATYCVRRMFKMVKTSLSNN